MQAAAITIARPANITVTEQDLSQDASQAHLHDRHSLGAAERRTIRTALQPGRLVRLLSFAWCAVALMVIGLSLALAGVEGFFVQFLVTLGIVFPPATALMIHSALFERSGGERSWHWPNLAFWALASAASWIIQVSGTGLTSISALDGFIVAFALAFATRLIRRPHVVDIVS